MLLDAAVSGCSVSAVAPTEMQWRVSPRARVSIQGKAVERASNVIQSFGSCVVQGCCGASEVKVTLLERAVACGMLEIVGWEGVSNQLSPSQHSVTTVFKSLFERLPDPQGEAAEFTESIDSAIARVFQLVAHRLYATDTSFASILYTAAASANVINPSLKNEEASSEIPVFSAAGLHKKQAAYACLAVSQVFATIVQASLYPFNLPCSVHLSSSSKMAVSNVWKSQFAQDATLKQLRTLSAHVVTLARAGLADSVPRGSPIEQIIFTVCRGDKEAAVPRGSLDEKTFNAYRMAAVRALGSGLIGIAATQGAAEAVRELPFQEWTGPNRDLLAMRFARTNPPAKMTNNMSCDAAKVVKQIAPIAADAAVAAFPFDQAQSESLVLSSDSRFLLSRSIRAAARVSALFEFPLDEDAAMI